MLEFGQVVEEGTHAELMEKRGKYYELFSTQAKRYVSEGERINGEVDEPIPAQAHRFTARDSDEPSYGVSEDQGEL